MKTLKIFFLTLMLAGLLVSCGGADTPAAEPDATETNDEADAPEATEADAPADASTDAPADDATDAPADAPAEEPETEEGHEGHDH